MSEVVVGEDPCGRGTLTSPIVRVGSEVIGEEENTSSLSSRSFLH